MPGDHVAYIDGPIVVFKKITPTISRRMLNWIGVSRHSWINTDKSLFQYINHGCEPNVAQISARKVIAIKSIKKNTELLMDYSLTEAEESWQIGPCNCGTKSCRSSIQSIISLPNRTFAKYKPYIPKKFQQVYLAAQQSKMD
jgi:hypothetical protein